MSRTGLVVGAMALAVVATVDAAPRAGRVVRVERGMRRVTGAPRMCAVNTADLSGLCYGRQPMIGEHVTLVGRERVIATVEVTATSPYLVGCIDGSQWQVQTRLERGDLNPSQGGIEYGTIDVVIDTRTTKLVPIDATRTPLGTAAQIDTVVGFDLDGDGAPDLEFVVYYCDDAGSPATVQDAKCLDVWGAVAKRKFTRVRQDRIRNC
jgi:hypothetical protein